MSKRTSIPFLEFATLVVVVTGCIIAVVPGADKYAAGLFERRPTSAVESPAVVSDESTWKPTIQAEANIENELVGTFEEPQSALEIGSDDNFENDWGSDVDSAEVTSALEVKPSEPEPESIPSKKQTKAILVSQQREIESAPELPAPKSSSVLDAGASDTEYFNSNEGSDDHALEAFLDEAEEEMGIDEVTSDVSIEPVASTDKVPFFIQPISENAGAESVMEGNEFNENSVVEAISPDANSLHLTEPVDPMSSVAPYSQNQPPERVALNTPIQNSNVQHREYGQLNAQPTRASNENNVGGWSTNPTTDVAPAPETRQQPVVTNSGGSQNRNGSVPKQHWKRIKNSYLENSSLVPSTTPAGASGTHSAPAQIRNEHLN